jgi:hypothetical protein
LIFEKLELKEVTGTESEAEVVLYVVDGAVLVGDSSGLFVSVTGTYPRTGSAAETAAAYGREGAGAAISPEEELVIELGRPFVMAPSPAQGIAAFVCVPVELTAVPRVP